MTVGMKAGSKLRSYRIDQLQFLREMMTLAVGVLNGIRDDRFFCPEMIMNLSVSSIRILRGLLDHNLLPLLFRFMI